ncbi:unnamed protein product [Vicia faba]|uniref:Uncharacterized protein n=1 Tax=Vicia faba TaxID=3906 RepID=A0AAV1AVT3_VICFA|nr:unnamed protein product [Vicia faba]
MWMSILGITIDDEPMVKESNYHSDFKWRIHSNEKLKTPRASNNKYPIINGCLKKQPRIMHWIVSHILRPKNGGFSRVDVPEVHLVYLLLNKIKINWPYYIVYNIFRIHDCNRGTAFPYASMIAKIINSFDIDLPNLAYISPTENLEFSKRTIKNLRYYLDPIRRV